ncbi:glutathione peroxidase [Microbacterium elymi]|uniref:Glutathione peroxidase n=1 Tax=Microbacterium elymi TaxID=2909587 RepID=A0ABY5NJN8_9MICO|nr:glutathione peroxidase [Microbacterium elymi]UUT35339.1 glutathione peroxidase [Microbacterium elymi]
MTDLHDIPFQTADGGTATLGDFDSPVLMIVNVASRCGFTPQYEQLEKLQQTYGDRGFSVLGFPCNQFKNQEPGTIDEIVDYCTTTWGVTFPVLDKVEVNGSGAAPLYQALTQTADAAGTAGPVAWNFEKFVLTPTGQVHRFRSATVPDDPAVVELIEANLPA